MVWRQARGTFLRDMVCEKSPRKLRLFLPLVGLGVVLVALLLRQPASRTGEPVVVNQTAVPPVPTLDAERVSRGASLYAENCASCHGANLEGAPNWKQTLADGSFPPPPHDSSGHTWHHSDALLLSIMAKGGDPAYNSRMPAFEDKLTQEERSAILEFFKSRWGKDEREFQWWMTATGSDTTLLNREDNQTEAP